MLDTHIQHLDSAVPFHVSATAHRVASDNDIVVNGDLFDPKWTATLRAFFCVVFQRNWRSMRNSLDCDSRNATRGRAPSIQVPVGRCIAVVSRDLSGDARDSGRAVGASCCHLVTTCSFGHCLLLFLSWSKALHTDQARVMTRFAV